VKKPSLFTVWAAAGQVAVASVELEQEASEVPVLEQEASEKLLAEGVPAVELPEELLLAEEEQEVPVVQAEPV
jgi:hypothetical protein